MAAYALDSGLVVNPAHDAQGPVPGSPARPPPRILLAMEDVTDHN